MKINKTYTEEEELDEPENETTTEKDEEDKVNKNMKAIRIVGNMSFQMR